MEPKYKEWINTSMWETQKYVLMTIGNITEDAKKELTMTELEKLDHCWSILAHIEKVEHIHAVAEKKNAA